MPIAPKPQYALFAWLLYVAIAIAVIVALGYSHPWFLQSENSSTVAYASFWLAVGGVLLTAAGFLVTLQQLIKIVTASEAADNALNMARRSLAALACSGEVERAKIHLRACQEASRIGDPAAFQISLIEARQVLFRIQQRKLPQFSDYSDEISQSVTDMAQLSDQIDGTEAVSVSKLNGWLRTHTDLVDKLEVKLSEA